MGGRAGAHYPLFRSRNGIMGKAAVAMLAGVLLLLALPELPSGYQVAVLCAPFWLAALAPATPGVGPVPAPGFRLVLVHRRQSLSRTPHA